MNTFESMEFTHETHGKQELAIAEYEGCKFSNLDLSNRDFSRYRFIDCVFKDCNLSLSLFNDTLFNGIEINNGKMIGVHFDYFKKFGLSIKFNNCNLTDGIFYAMDLRNMRFRQCTLHGVDFSDANLEGLNLSECDLLDSKFDNSVLVKADLSTAINYTIDPNKNNIKKTRFAQAGLAGLLLHYDINII